MTLQNRRMQVMSKLYGEGLKFRVQALISHFKTKWPNPLHRARAAHVAVDQLVEENLAKVEPEGLKISCKKGCAHCCYQHVPLMEAEKDLILRHMEEKDLVLGEEAQSRLRRQGNALKRGEWDKLRHEDKACIFLGEDQTCQIYPVRPMACRSYMVVSPPSQCNHRFGVQRVEIVQMPMVDLTMYGAFLTEGADKVEENIPQKFFRLLKRKLDIIIAK